MISLPFANYSHPSKDFCGIALIGEAPGAQEIVQGRPFVGRSGVLLNKMLVGAGIDRDACFIANVFRYQPPKNKVDHFFISRKQSIAQNIPMEEGLGKFGSAYCRGEFAGEIENLANSLREQKVRIVIALGRTPMWALTGKNGLIAHAGQILENRLCPAIPVLTTFHPSFILRGNWKLQDVWQEHFVLAKTVS